MLGLVTCGVLAAGAAPLPRAVELEGLHAYAEKIVAAGDTIRFRVSSTVPYELSICRLGPQIDDPAGDEVLKTFAISEPTPQPVHPGSFVHVDKPLPADESLAGLSLEVWVRPWSVKGWQTLISQHNYPVHCGFGLFLDGDGRLNFYLGDGADYRADGSLVGPKLKARRWHHVVGTFDGKTKSLWVDGQRVGLEKGDTFGGAPGGMLPAYSGLDYFTRKVPLKNATVAHMLYWERPQGGRVFHAGSLGSGWGLSVDRKFQTLIRNALDHFGVPADE